MDMLVNLRDLPSLDKEIEKMKEIGVKIQSAFPPDMLQILEFVENQTGRYASGEARNCFGKMKPSMVIATRGNKVIGYACYDATAPDFFGPTEVADDERKKGIGRALLVAAMHELKNEGYGYAIVGSVGPAAFYEKVLGAVAIESSKEHTVYEDFLRN